LSFFLLIPNMAVRLARFVRLASEAEAEACSGSGFGRGDEWTGLSIRVGEAPDLGGLGVVGVVGDIADEGNAGPTVALARAVPFTSPPDVSLSIILAPDSATGASCWGEFARWPTWAWEGRDRRSVWLTGRERRGRCVCVRGGRRGDLPLDAAAKRRSRSKTSDAIRGSVEWFIS